MLSATELIKKLESIKLRYQKQHNTQIPYFKRIIEELKGISLVAEIFLMLLKILNIFKIIAEKVPKNILIKQ
ncbi:hypothetical protein [Spiroplasma ixodetis]|uniref:hypothetical protein n=1 Tax=Spiroplasma ixodetis TaxID=2141 RepID=UPI002575E7DF|nr:hypothetical protein [Spiroplasma ixodetis]WJG69700.1 hypothetical protein SIXOD_v1c06310 [Spiroplasma ixodetis Y32]